MFTRFGGVADERVQARITRGERLRALLVQPQFAPLRLADEVALAIALREGLFDAISVETIGGLRQALPNWLDRQAGAAVASIERNGTMTGDETASLRNAVAALLARQAGDGAMANDLAAVRTRIHGIQQLDTVIGAMRGIAAAHAQQSRQLLPGFRAYAAVIAGAIASALRLREPVRPAPSGVGRRVRVVFCAEQGFVGGFAERILDEALLRGPADLLLIGSRGSSLAGARKVTVAWQSAMATQMDGITPLCIRIAAALYDFILTRQIVTAEVAFPLWTPGKGLSVACQLLLPLDERRFGTASAAPPPLTTLPPEVLLASLAEEYVLASLCEAAMHAFVAENEARAAAMVRARGKVQDMLDRLRLAEHHLRQESITAEVVELAGSLISSRSNP